MMLSQKKSSTVQNHLKVYISKKNNMRPAASCALYAPDIAGAYNVNSSSGSGRSGCNLTQPPYLPCAQRTTLRSCSLQSPSLRATRFPTSCDFNLLLPKKPHKRPPSWVSSYDTMLPPDSVPNPPGHLSFHSLPPNPIAYSSVFSGRAPALDLFPPYLRILLFILRYPADASYNLSPQPAASYNQSRRPDVPYNLSRLPDVPHNLSPQPGVPYYVCTQPDIPYNLSRRPDVPHNLSP